MSTKRKGILILIMLFIVVARAFKSEPEIDGGHMAHLIYRNLLRR